MTAAKKRGRNLWIETGYREMARSGIDAIRIDHIARKLGKSRSGFYHSFGDKEGFEAALLDHHLDQARNFAARAENTSSFYPEYVDLIVEFKDFSFFIKQLFLLQNSDEKYAETFRETVGIIRPVNIKVWKKFANLEQKQDSELHGLFEIIRDTVFAKIDYESFDRETFYDLIKELNRSFHFLLPQ